MYKQQNAATIPIRISNAEIFFPLTAGKIKKVKVYGKSKKLLKGLLKSIG